ncbi:hypothetical protein BaRGS_00007973, partial [Batillaria attramentaria]
MRSGFRPLARLSLPCCLLIDMRARNLPDPRRKQLPPFCLLLESCSGRSAENCHIEERATDAA